jgi:hypothetical protein
MTGIPAAITAALTAYSSWVRWQIEKYHYEKMDDLEDCIDALAGDGSPSAKLRLERLAIRKKRHAQCIIRSTDSDVTPPKAIRVQGGDADGPGSEVS